MSHVTCIPDGTPIGFVSLGHTSRSYTRCSIAQREEQMVRSVGDSRSSEQESEEGK